MNENSISPDLNTPGPNPGRGPLPPPLPRPPGSGPAPQAETCHPNGQKFADEFRPMARGTSPLQVAENLLRFPARVAFEVLQGRRGTVAAALLLLVAVGIAAYGLLMGSFAGGPQWWAVPVKVLIGLFASALLCFPCLYIFTCLAGARQTPIEMAVLLLQSLALSIILLLGFAPITWIFSQSTYTVAFMGLLHLAFWSISIAFGLCLLGNTLAFLNRRRIGLITLWSLVFITVSLQMCTALRPLVGRFQDYPLQERKLFFAQWYDCLDKNESVADPRPPRPK